MYTIMGYYPVLRRQMNNEFKRVGFNGIKEKRWFLHKILGFAPKLSEMTISEMEHIIDELQKYKNIDEIK